MVNIDRSKFANVYYNGLGGFNYNSSDLEEKKINRNSILSILKWLLLFLLLLGLIIYIFNFKKIYADEVRTVVSNDKLGILKDRVKIIGPIGSGYTEIETSDNSIISGADIGIIGKIIPPIYSTKNCNENDKLWHLNAIDFNDVVSDYININYNRVIKIGIIDSGLSGITSLTGFSILDNDYSDKLGHGTFVASIIKQISPKSEIIPIQISKGQEMTNLDVMKGINIAIKNKVDIINLSLGGYNSDSKFEKDIINQAISNGIIVVAAAGNEGGDVKLYYPVSFDGVLGVGANDRKYEIASFSNKGEKIDSRLPGECIYGSGISGESIFADGTSFSAPILVGLLANYYSINSGLSTNESDIKTIIQKSVIKKGNIDIINAPLLYNIHKEINQLNENNNIIIEKIKLSKEIFEKNLVKIKDNEIKELKKDITNTKNNILLLNLKSINPIIIKNKSLLDKLGISGRNYDDIANYISKANIYPDFDLPQLQVSNDKKLLYNLGVESCIAKTGLYLSCKDHQINNGDYGCDDRSYSDSICGHMDNIIKKGTSLPIFGVQNYSTISENQSEIKFDIYEGEGYRAKQNSKIGSLLISGLPKKAKGEAGAIIEFRIDEYGILRVNVIDESNGKNTKSVTIKKTINSKSSESLSGNINEVISNTQLIINQAVNIINSLNANNIIDDGIHKSLLVPNNSIDKKCEYQKVSKIIDGDTFEIRNNIRIRIIGINAPEVGEYYYNDATKGLSDFILGKEICLYKDIISDDVDVYGRLLRHIDLGGKSIEEYMIINGFARYYDKYKFDFMDQYSKFELKAKANNIGIRKGN